MCFPCHLQTDLEYKLNQIETDGLSFNDHNVSGKRGLTRRTINDRNYQVISDHPDVNCGKLKKVKSPRDDLSKVKLITKLIAMQNETNKVIKRVNQA